MAKRIGLPIKQEKTVLPTTCLVFMRLEFDTVSMEIRLPLEKLEKCRKMVNMFMIRNWATLRESQSLIGLLNHACAVVLQGRTFLRRIIDLARGIQQPNEKRGLNKEAKLDLRAWSFFLDSFNGKGLIQKPNLEQSVSLQMYTDASDVGFGDMGFQKACSRYGSASGRYINIGRASLTQLSTDIIRHSLSKNILDNYDRAVQCYMNFLAIYFPQGYDISLYKTHSFGIGAASTATNMGISDDKMKSWMQLVVWTLVVLPVLYSQGTNACPDQCSCTKTYLCDGTYVYCDSRELTGVPTDIPTDTCYLDLGNNKITTLPSGIFDALKSLQELFLQGNKITTLLTGTFDALSSLQTLDLKWNKISTLPIGIFDALTSLRYLDLRWNKISTLPIGIFDALTSLRYLLLQGNGITTLLTGTFDALTSLQTLYLSNNKLTTLQTGIFDQLGNLQTLVLSDNKLTTLQTGTFDQLVNLQQLDVGGNPLHCDCKVVAFIHFMKTKRLQLHPYSWRTEPSCQNPLNLKETLLKDISLQEVVCDSDSTTVTTVIDTTVLDSTTVTTGISTTVIDFRSASTETDTAVTEIAGFGKYSTCTKTCGHCMIHCY
ncbi:leucine-rich repeat-containing protein 15-like [Ostrea edulis]|uniref:leucine-rich repeat-containing protein 15-like n=1 Tax=Ostrea edulis TaxID=37623 RepID=UPI0024AF7ECE|nr:leucine-rich repeat-containing protein 15-like [Ostrea edulis]